MIATCNMHQPSCTPAQKWKNRTLVGHALSRKANLSIGSPDNRQLTQKIKYHRFAVLYCGWPSRAIFPFLGGVFIHSRMLAVYNRLEYNEILSRDNVVDLFKCS